MRRWRPFSEDRVYFLRLLTLPAAVRVPALAAVERLWDDYQDYLARPDCARWEPAFVVYNRTLQAMARVVREAEERSALTRRTRST